MDIKLSFAGLVFKFEFEKNLIVNEELKPFIVKDDCQEDIKVIVSWNWTKVKVPTKTYLGEDAIQCYYHEDSYYYCMTKAGPKGFIGCAIYKEDCKIINCYLNEEPFLTNYTTINPIIRLLPMRAIFQHFHVMFFHSSQIVYDNLGIMFTAPARTGKTTQASLWCKYMNAKLICNDRTLVKNKKTYGYPIDGSSPVRSDEVHNLGCIVLLRQSPVNSIQKLSMGKALALLMEQLVLDVWNGEAKQKALDDLIILLKDIPVYLLSCTPDEKAVKCLYNCLKGDGIINEKS